MEKVSNVFIYISSVENYLFLKTFFIFGVKKGIGRRNIFAPVLYVLGIFIFDLEYTFFFSFVLWVKSIEIFGFRRGGFFW